MSEALSRPLPSKNVCNSFPSPSKQEEYCRNQWKIKIFNQGSKPITYTPTHRTDPPIGQVIKTNEQNLLLRRLYNDEQKNSRKRKQNDVVGISSTISNEKQKRAKLGDNPHMNHNQ